MEHQQVIRVVSCFFFFSMLSCTENSLCVTVSLKELECHRVEL